MSKTKTARAPGDPLSTSYNGDVLVVEYHQNDRGRWVPHTIVTTDGTYDAEWSKAQGLLVHNSGGGNHPGGTHLFNAYTDPDPASPPCRFWMASCMRPVRYRESDPGSDRRSREVPVAEKQILQMGYQRIPVLIGDPFTDAREVDGHIEECAICNDYYDDDESAPCSHMRWSDDASRMVGAGVVDSEAHDVPESIDALCRELGLRMTERLREALASLEMWHSYDALGEALGGVDDAGESHGGSGCEIAMLWLDTLDTTPALRPAVVKTIHWLDAHLDQRTTILAGDRRPRTLVRDGAGRFWRDGEWTAIRAQGRRMHDGKARKVARKLRRVYPRTGIRLLHLLPPLPPKGDGR